MLISPFLVKILSGREGHYRKLFSFYYKIGYEHCSRMFVVDQPVFSGSLPTTEAFCDSIFAHRLDTDDHTLDTVVYDLEQATRRGG